MQRHRGCAYCCLRFDMCDMRNHWDIMSMTHDVDGNLESADPIAIPLVCDTYNLYESYTRGAIALTTTW